jgi:hypothetical protein
MNVRKIVLVLGLALSGLLTMSAFSCEAQSVTGVVEEKYIEDFTEPTLVVKEDGTGEVHHFTVDSEVWRDTRVGSTYVGTQQVGED